MNYLEYINQVPKYWPGGRLLNAAASIFSRTPKDNWDQENGIVTIGGKQYNTSDKAQVADLLEYLISQGHNIGSSKSTGVFGNGTKGALNRIFKTQSLEAKPAAKEASSDKTPILMKAYLFLSSPIHKVTSNPATYAVKAGVTGSYNKYIANPISDKISEVSPTLGETTRKVISKYGDVRTNLSITPEQQRIYNHIGNYLIKNKRSSLDTSDINKWYRSGGGKELMKEMGYELPDDWRYSKNDLGWGTKLFNPLELVMNINGRMSLDKDDKGNYYFTDLYDHNKSTYIGDSYINNSKSLDLKSYLNVVKFMQNYMHPSDEDPDYLKRSTRIKIYQ